MLARAVAEGVEIGDEVAELAEGVDEVGDVGPGPAVAGLGRGGAGARRRLPRREPVFDPGEDQRPALVDRARIPPVVLPEGGDVRGVGPRQLIERPWVHSSPGPACPAPPSGGLPASAASCRPTPSGRDPWRPWPRA